jgi:hypothetical protein
MALEKVPISSKVLSAVAQRPPMTRNIWLKELDDDELSIYVAHCSRPQAIEDLALQYSWMNIARLGIAAERLQDPVVQLLVQGALEIKAKKVVQQADKVFGNDVLEYVYSKTTDQSQFRRTFVALVLATDGLVHSASSSLDFLKLVLDGGEGSLNPKQQPAQQQKLHASDTTDQIQKPPVIPPLMSRTESGRRDRKLNAAVPLELWQGSDAVDNVEHLPPSTSAQGGPRTPATISTGAPYSPSNTSAKTASPLEPPTKSSPLTTKPRDTPSGRFQPATSPKKDRGSETLLSTPLEPGLSAQTAINSARLAAKSGNTHMRPTAVATALKQQCDATSAIDNAADLPPPTINSPVATKRTRTVSKSPSLIVKLPVATGSTFPVPTSHLPMVKSQIATRNASIDSKIPSTPKPLSRMRSLHREPASTLLPQSPGPYGKSVLRGRLSVHNSSTGSGQEASKLSLETSVKEKPVRQPQLPPSVEGFKKAPDHKHEGCQNFVWHTEPRH